MNVGLMQQRSLLAFLMPYFCTSVPPHWSLREKWK